MLAESTTLGSILSLDFSFIELVLSSFLGFGFALLVEAIVQHRNDRKTKRQLLTDLKQELSSLYNIACSLEPNKIYIRPYHTPVWTGAIDSNSILLLDKEKYYIDLIEVFSSIEEGNMIEMKCFEMCFENHDRVNDLIKQTLADNRKHVREQITSGMKMIERR